ncbi:CDP-alcohol phosphatidyltransferase family protein [Desmospora profundinema]|uniref:Phosphatidylglycerophosphate synthase n=1 Tax=Desmospora profundinema TaxID=1571184 RepID=A0ABU1IMV4_9BACL|nr:CDP-alcohol phosphatidyltransferase family protein [Desmospora profundinema]MDR6225877.1 phosphatidylglycerophosphate synthase [Desmospora profundinema]
MKRDTEKKLPTLPVDSGRILAYRERCQKPRHMEEIWSWFVLRRISIYVTLMLSRTPLTPNGISWISLLFFGLTGWFLLTGNPWGWLLAVLSYNLGYLCDCMDGELARIKGITSDRGVFLDTLIRALSIPVWSAAALMIPPAFGWGEWGLAAASWVYGIVLVSTLALLVPLSFNYIHVKRDENDPVSYMRTQSGVMEWIAFLTGMPGYFAMLPLVILADALTGMPVMAGFTAVFLLMLAAKTFLRLYLTTSKLN